MSNLSTYRQGPIGYLLWILIIVISIFHMFLALWVGDYRVALGEAFIGFVCWWACVLERELTRRNFPKEIE